MKINKGYIVAGLIIAFSLFFELAAHADESVRAFPEKLKPSR